MVSWPVPFLPYEKIPERLESYSLTEEAHRILRKQRWVVTEKIHGANFALVTDGDLVRAAKRKGFLSEDEDFFGHRTIVHTLVEPLRKLYGELCTSRGTKGSPLLLTVYGELFGGKYPHKDVPAVKGVQAVQTGVYYCPGIAFCAFDLRFGEEYLDYEEACALFGKVGIFHAQPLLIGKLEDTLRYPLGFDSTIPRHLGLPPLEERNKAEGVVVKPVAPVKVPGKNGLVRPLLKRKIPEFAEDRRFHEATSWVKHEARLTGIDLLQVSGLLLITEARLQNVISKEGRPKKKDAATVAMLSNLLVEDAWTQLVEDQGAVLGSLDAGETTVLRVSMDKEAAELVGLYVEVYC